MDRKIDPNEQENDEIHRRIAGLIRRDPTVVERARERLERRLAETPLPAWVEWKQALAMLDPPQLADFLESTTPRARRMRISSPFFFLARETAHSAPCLPQATDNPPAEVLMSPEVGGMEACSPEVNDLAISKLAAGRLKDNEMVAALIASKYADVETIRGRITSLADVNLRAALLARLQIVLENVG